VTDGLRRVWGGLLLALGRDRGVTLVQTDRWTVAEELWSFGEDALYPVALELSDEDMVRLWLVAGRLLLNEKAGTSGEAAALAAVEVIEGKRRPLARKRRRPRASRLRFEQTPEERYDEIRRIEESPTFRDEWG
jgi:hypothetical protein